VKHPLRVAIPVGLVLLAAAALVVRTCSNAGEQRAVRAQLLEDVRTAVAQESPDGSELSRLVTRIQAQPEAQSDRALVLALARIELCRGRYDRAWEHIMPFATGGGASPEELRFAAELQLHRHAAGVKDARGTETLRQVVAAAEAAHASSHEPDDLLLAWQAAVRARDAAEAERLAASLQREHDGSAAAALTVLAKAFDPAQPAAPLDELAGRFRGPLPELDVMRALARVNGDARGAATLLEPLLRRAPALVEVRAAAAATWHVLAFQAADDAERSRLLAQRDAHLQWLLDNAPPDDARLAAWTRLRTER
jgi:hypothetical protein